MIKVTYTTHGRGDENMIRSKIRTQFNPTEPQMKFIN